jgi:hypothetical protein
VGYSVQRDASPLRHITLDQATKVAAAAFAQWDGATCNRGAPSIQARDLGPVDCGEVAYSSTQPNQHVIVFRDDGWPYSDSSNTLGLTTITFDVTNGEIYDADTELNTHDYDFVVGSGGPIGSYDLTGVITHEAGHFLGLAHSGDRDAVMYAHYHSGASALTTDDTDGICSAYPAGGARETSSGALTGDTCDATPRHGFSTACASADAGSTAAASPTADAGSGGAVPMSSTDGGAPAMGGTDAALETPHGGGGMKAVGPAAATGGSSETATRPASAAENPAPARAAAGTTSIGLGGCSASGAAGGAAGRGWWWLLLAAGGAGSLARLRKVQREIRFPFLRFVMFSSFSSRSICSRGTPDASSTDRDT